MHHHGYPQGCWPWSVSAVSPISSTEYWPWTVNLVPRISTGIPTLDCQYNVDVHRDADPEVSVQYRGSWTSTGLRDHEMSVEYREFLQMCWPWNRECPQDRRPWTVTTVSWISTLCRPWTVSKVPLVYTGCQPWSREFPLGCRPWTVRAASRIFTRVLILHRQYNAADFYRGADSRLSLPCHGLSQRCWPWTASGVPWISTGMLTLGCQYSVVDFHRSANPELSVQCRGRAQGCWICTTQHHNGPPD